MACLPGEATAEVTSKAFVGFYRDVGLKKASALIRVCQYKNMHGPASLFEVGTLEGFGECW
jgi:hypothetical protein